MTDRPRRRRPLITSTLALRVLASAITLSSFGGMTVFASENLHASNAPLQPAAAVATATPATTVTASRTTTTRRSVTTTSTAALTRTKQS
ncbi:MAG: hypothetical protein E6I48_07480 [Chloroflexi bacterium]|nr:MAG: hypothetical protein E6I48_07480 [Chloroflexota bacterium]